MTTTLAKQLSRINLVNGGSMQSSQAVTLNLDNRTLLRLAQNRQLHSFELRRGSTFSVLLPSHGLNRKLPDSLEGMRSSLGREAMMTSLAGTAAAT